MKKPTSTTTTSNGGDDDLFEHTAFRRWVYSLTRSQLLNAMEFSVQVDGNPNNNHMVATTTTTNNFNSSNNNNNNTSHEYELFLEMITLQPPLFCPIHPRAVSYQVASGMAKTDGRNTAVKVLRSRIQQPRLFQFLVTNVPPSYSSRPAISNSYYGRRRGGPRKRAVAQQQHQQLQQQQQEQRFQVFARKFITDWGDALNIGCTREQQLADEQIMKGTLIDPKLGADRTFIAFSGGVTNSNYNNHTSDLLRLLQVVSRGHFLSKPHRQSTTIRTPPFCSPWLDPTARWFSLPMYMASRFEVALWDSFSERRTGALHRGRPWDQLQQKLNEQAIRTLVHRALGDTLRQDIIKDVAPSKLRDGLLFDLMDSIEFWRAKQNMRLSSSMSTTSGNKDSMDIFLQAISATPLLEIGTTTHQLRTMIRQRLQVEISKEMERHLIDSLDSGTAGITTTPSQNGAMAPQTAASRRNKKKKQRKKAARKRQPQKTSQSPATPSPQHGGEASDDDDDSDGAKPAKKVPEDDAARCRLAFPDNGTPFVERNRNIVLCLSVLNDAINNAFRQVGLDVSSDESDSSIVHGNRGRQGQGGGTNSSSSTPKAAITPKGRHGANSNASTPKAAITPKGRHAASSNAGTPKAAITPRGRQHGAITPKNRKMASPPKIPAVPANSNNNNKPWKSFQPFRQTPQNMQATQEEYAMPPSHAPFQAPPQEHEVDTPSISPTPGSVDTFPSQHCFSQGFFLRSAPFESNPWGFYHGEDGWGGADRFPAREPRERSILAEFFLEQERADANRLERFTASSTAASLASSTDKNNEDTISISDKFFISLDNGSEAQASEIASTIISADEFPSLDIYQEEKTNSADSQDEKVAVSQSEGNADIESPTEFTADAKKEDNATPTRSMSPEAPATPSPRLSPILLSLDDLRDIREGAKSVGTRAQELNNLPLAVAPTVPSSLPSSPVEQSKRRLVPSLSREDLRIRSFRDDHGFVPKARRRTAEAASGSPSYRNVAAGTLRAPAVRSISSEAFPKSFKKDSRFAYAQKDQKQEADACARSENAVDLHDESQHSSGAPSYRNVAAKSVKSVSGGSWNARNSPVGKARNLQRDLCARSETAMEGHEDLQNWHDSRRSHDDHNADNITVGKDGSTTITSAMSHRESEETSHLREELQNFRDLVLTLGAEVSKLKNQLAAQHGGTAHPPFDYSKGYVQPVVGAASFDPECMPPFFQKGQAIGAMSDAGIHRGEYEQSQISEDDEAKAGYNDGRRMSSGATIAGSDVSIEPANSSHALQGPVGLPAPMSRDSHAENGLQTRLTEDILRFLANTEMQHRKLDTTRDAAVERMTRLVNTLWPRAQVKLYGSHVTGLCLPSSDLDFVICLPAVHKIGPAVAPGVLEGRNAINETSQKLLARKLKGESWVDPRSIKLIERTVVPVIKVATKDTRARTTHLDISFDSPEHHGLDAVVMVKQIVEELPMIRPLVLILKQFLLDRGLLTAYTGGLSSYCLFLMVARYLQEQPSSWGDCGSLLMGFLDFYGNCFDPRSTGISVGRRQYFTRPNYVAAQRQAAGQHMWPGVSPSPAVMPTQAATGGNPGFYRRNTVGESGGGPLMRPPRFQAAGTPVTRFMRHMPHPTEHALNLEAPMDHAMPYTFDPLFVEDPLSYGNNVGRNSFRIFQVQRAFSDAHRALVASLEWEFESTGENNNDYPLLKCLLQSEDVLYEL